MYWNNTWLNNFNYKNFLNKTLFLENFFLFIFSEKIFKTFFEKTTNNTIINKLFLKKIKKFSFFRKNKLLFKKIIKKKNTVKHHKYNFSKVWFVKYNNYLLITTFVYYFFKIKNRKKFKTKNKFLNKVPILFWKKRKGPNIKKKIFFKKSYLFF